MLFSSFSSRKASLSKVYLSFKSINNALHNLHSLIFSDSSSTLFSFLSPPSIRLYVLILEWLLPVVKVLLETFSVESFAFKPESPQENLLYRPSPYFFLLSQIQRPIQWKGRLLTFWPPFMADGCYFLSEIIGAWDLQGERKCPRECGSGTLLRRFLHLPPFVVVMK